MKEKQHQSHNMTLILYANINLNDLKHLHIYNKLRNISLPGHQKPAPFPNKSYHLNELPPAQQRIDPVY